jgi:hypothetical protein
MLLNVVITLVYFCSPGKNGLGHDDLPHMVFHGVQAQPGLSDDVTECRHYFGIFVTWRPIVFRHSQV